MKQLFIDPLAFVGVDFFRQFLQVGSAVVAAELLDVELDKVGPFRWKDF